MNSPAYVWLTHEVNIFASKKWLQPSILPNGDDWQYSLLQGKGVSSQTGWRYADERHPA